MKLSELKKEIKEYIVEILSEEDMDEGTYVGPEAADDLQKDPKFAAAKDKTTAINTLKAGGSVTLEEDDDEDREPTKAELAKEKVKGAPSKFKVSTDQFEDFNILDIDDDRYLVVWDKPHTLSPSGIRIIFKDILFLSKTDFIIDTKISMEQLREYVKSRTGINNSGPVRAVSGVREMLDQTIRKMKDDYAQHS